MKQKKEKIKYLKLIGCFLGGCILILESCFNFSEYNADKHFEYKHTKEYETPDSSFLIQKTMWYLVRSKQTEFSGDFDSLEIENYLISLYRNGEKVVNEKVIRDFDQESGYNRNKICFFSENSEVNYYYMVNYLDSMNLVLSIDNYKSKWRKEAWFQFSKNKNNSNSPN